MFYLRTDASNLAAGAILLQEHENELFPIHYASKKISRSEVNWSITEKECYAIVFGVKKFYNYLYDNEFILETDHRSLKYLETSKFCNSRLMRWAMILQPFRMKGSHNIGADYLSRQYHE